MAEEIRKYLHSLLTKVDGLNCILISDRDGVPIVKAVRENIPDSALRPSFISTFGMATDQASKLGLGRNKAVVTIYSNYQVVHISKPPMVVTFIAKHDSNTGLILTLEDHLETLLPDLKKAILDNSALGFHGWGQH